jgi:crotonobetaine/carnitine-CoA ligase
MTEDDRIRGFDFPRMIARAATLYRDRPYLRFEDQSWSFADAHALSNRLANGLLAFGVKPHDHVALLLDNCPEIVWYYFALGKMGGVSVPLNTAAKGELLGRYLRQAKASCLVVEAGLVDRIRDLVPSCPEIRRVIVVGEGGAEGWGMETTDHGSLLSAPAESPPVDVRFSDLAYLSFTSGTSGPSKANLATHAHTFAMATALGRAFAYGPDDVLYTCLPLYHGNAMRSLFVAIDVGCSIALARRFSASGFWNDVRRLGATQFNLLGAMANILWAQPAAETDDDGVGRKCMIVPMPSFATAFADRFNLRMYSTYALTDFGYLTFLTPDAPADKGRSAGRVQPDIELAILDDDDFAVPAGQAGEICARTRRPWVSAQGYFDMPEASVAAWRNLWFHTGDSGYLDEDGYLFFVDRKKDSIRRRGENISAYEVEQIMLHHPAIAEVAAFAVDSDMSEDEVMVSVVRRPDAALDEAALVGWCSGQMASFMVPRYVEFLDVLPRTPTEKVEKYILRDRAKRDIETIWDRERAGIKIAR